MVGIIDNNWGIELASLKLKHEWAKFKANCTNMNEMMNEMKKNDWLHENKANKCYIIPGHMILDCITLR